MTLWFTKGQSQKNTCRGGDDKTTKKTLLSWYRMLTVSVPHGGHLHSNVSFKYFPYSCNSVNVHKHQFSIHAVTDSVSDWRVHFLPRCLHPKGVSGSVLTFLVCCGTQEADCNFCSDPFPRSGCVNKAWIAGYVYWISTNYQQWVKFTLPGLSPEVIEQFGLEDSGSRRSGEKAVISLCH